MLGENGSNNGQIRFIFIFIFVYECILNSMNLNILDISNQTLSNLIQCMELIVSNFDTNIYK